MANELIYVYTSEVTLEDSGGSIANTSFGAADLGSLTSANHLDYPLADFVLTAGFAANVAGGTYINLYRQDFDISGTVDSEAPGVAYPRLFVGRFQLKSGVSVATAFPCSDVPLSRVCQFSVEVQSGQTMAAGWTLKCTPKSFGPAT